MNIRDVMSSPVIRVKPETKVSEALQVMMASKVGGLPIVNDRNHVVGILTHGDILRRARRHHPLAFDFLLYSVVIIEQDQEVHERLERLLTRSVEKMCTSKVITCSPDDQAIDVAGLMIDHRVRRVPVVSARGVLVGIVTRGDLTRALWEEHTRQG